ncbi:hypothetical protein [Actinomadura sp. WMMB 499]|uniref:hypothetical protein n=1 Tax=Actinomadura sp. WMMB 499 TaxID=1219491 RepID=UPI001244614B|nr:hypothetical protein [Actinomadura sp. WMMB 499]QFG22792.1 hypothetical protein F7P10_18380 [Actinomadura sp. WMMB 499]
MKHIPRTATVLTIGAATLFTLTACSGGGHSGTYFDDGRSAPIGRLIIDGDDVTYESFRCAGGSESSKKSQGVFNEDGNLITWTQEGRFVRSDPFTATSDGDVVTLGETPFMKEGSDAAQELIDDFEQLCTGRDGDWQSPL